MMKNDSFFGNALKFGLIISVFNILLAFVYYIFEVQMFSFGFIAANIIVGLLIVVGVFLIGIKSYRTGLGGVITFMQAFLQGLLIGVIAYVIIAVFNYVFYAFIAPEYAASQLDGFISFMEGFNLPDDVMDESIAKFKEGMTPIGQLKSGLQSGGIMSVIVSVILAASIKKDTTQAEIS